MKNSKINQAFQGIQQVPFHTHNGIDSPVISSTPTASYNIGYVTAAGAAGGFFPSGWTVSLIAGGHYQITHNLGTTNYAALVNAVQTACFARINSPGTATFDVILTDASGSNTSTDFNFGVFL